MLPLMTEVAFITSSYAGERRNARGKSAFPSSDARSLHTSFPHSSFPIRASRLRSFISAVFICLLSSGCQQPGAPIEVTDAWAPATPPNATVGAAYMNIAANSADTLAAASSPAAERVEVHETVHEGALVKMRKVGPLDLSPDYPIALQPGGRHFMLIGLKSPLQADTLFPLTLRFHNAGEIEIEIRVVAAGTDVAHH